MKSFFNKRFEEEVLINEKLRTKILACMFLFAMLYTFINGIILKERGIKQDEAHSLSQMFIFQLALFIFEVLTWLRITYKIKRNSYSIPKAARFVNSLIEICSPGVIILILARQFSSPLSVLHAPVVYLYFIFIILSTLRL